MRVSRRQIAAEGRQMKRPRLTEDVPELPTEDEVPS
jgi:hypothetical protein